MRRNIVTIAALVALPGLLVAGAVGGLTTFANGTVADATQVNANFTTMKAAVDDNDARLDTLEPAVGAHGTRLNALETLPAWTAATYQNGWTTYGTPYAPAGYVKDKAGIVRLRGLVRSGTVNACIFTLPAGFRPAYRAIFPVQTDPNTIARLDVDTAGCVSPSNASNGWVSLEGVSFRAEN